MDCIQVIMYVRDLNSGHLAFCGALLLPCAARKLLDLCYHPVLYSSDDRVFVKSKLHKASISWVTSFIIFKWGFKHTVSLTEVTCVLSGQERRKCVCIWWNVMLLCNGIMECFVFLFPRFSTLRIQNKS